MAGIASFRRLERRSNAPPLFAFATVLAAVVLFSHTIVAQQAEQPEGGAASPEEQTQYAGSEMCQACHEDIFSTFQKKNPHAVVETQPKHGWEGRACESCHGPGAKHSESADAGEILNPAKLSPARTDAICLNCHLNTPTHVGRVQGGHAKGQVSCVGCHPVHHAVDGEMAQRRHSRINAQCAACHTDVWASFQRPHAHRLEQRAMSCVDCHNPHGSFLPRNLQTALANEPGCFKCHGDKRGPFVFEHAPVRLDGCGSCHEPHGSANPRMLIRHEVSNLCLECHSNIFSPTGATASGVPGGIPTGFHDLRSARFRNCTICHVKVHGSHVNRDFLR
ncbi:MAG: DmsE family decaheme c-type cytochrome [Bryobacteraceae bacterium]|nr:DmsE family decaheme c-type cytochrome [Bryobacteraceae bacterium]